MTSYANDEVYEGEWRDNKRHGQGKQSYSSKDKYEG
jgi:hypothetical protein